MMGIKTLDFKRMVEEIVPLVETEWAAEMELRQLPHSRKITQDEAMQMLDIIGKVYLIAHAIHCEACSSKYTITAPPA
jgi:hypothetical protein